MSIVDIRRWLVFFLVGFAVGVDFELVGHETLLLRIFAVMITHANNINQCGRRGIKKNLIIILSFHEMVLRII